MKRKNGAVIKIVILSFVFLGLMPQVALAQAFINIIGIQGESQDRDHKNWIDVSSFSGSVPQPGASGTGSRGGPGQFHIVMRADRASAALNQACAAGRSIPAVTLDVRRTDGKPGFIRYTFQNVVVRLVNPMAGGSVPTETITLNYANVTLTYIPSEPSGPRPKPSALGKWVLPDQPKG